MEFSSLLDGLFAYPNNAFGGQIMSLDNGRWVLTKEFDLVDSQKQFVYKRDRAVPLDEVVWAEVPGLNVGASPLSLIYLATLMVKPLYLPKTVLLDGAKSPKVQVLNGKWLQPSQGFWRFPVGGIQAATPSGDYRYVPGASKYAVNETGIIIILSTGQRLIEGTGRKDVILETDLGGKVEIEPARVVALAFGDYNAVNWKNEIAFLDGNANNLNKNNINLGVELTEGLSRKGLPEELRTIV